MKITKKIFLDLAIYMIGFGIIIGIVFPFFTRLFGVKPEIAYSPLFFAACISAGIIVGAVNIILSRFVIGSKLKILISKMRMVRDNLIKVAHGGDPGDCTPQKCHIHIDSTDEIGETAKTFNILVDTLSNSLSIERTMQDYTKMLTSQLELEKLTKNALSHILSSTNLNAGAILVQSEGELKLLDVSGIKQPEKLSNHPMVIEILKTKKGRITDVPPDVKIDGLLLEFRPKTIIIEPLIYNDVAIGVIVLTSESKYTAADALSHLSMLLQSLSLALHNAIVHDQIQRLAAIDPLTGLLNRRYGMIRFNEEYSKAVRLEGFLGIIMFDIDHFKKVNDTYGHMVGDKVLIYISKLIKPILRKGDVIMRYGGEEFCAILPGASAKDSLEMAERLRFAIQEGKVNYLDYEVKVTLSLGVSSYPENNVQNEQDLLHAADKALYTSKESGRNKSTLG